MRDCEKTQLAAATNETSKIRGCFRMFRRRHFAIKVPIADKSQVSQASKMITEKEMMEPLLVADPTFLSTWQRLVEEYDDDVRPPIYIALGELAQHLIRRRERNDTQWFDEVFAVVERWHVEGDRFVSEAATVGFLESLQNWSGGNDRRKAALFEPYLGPVSRTWWEKVYSFWDGNDTALRLKN